MWSVVVQKGITEKFVTCVPPYDIPLAIKLIIKNLEACTNLVAWYYIVGVMITSSKEGCVCCGLISRSKYKVNLSHPSMKFYSFFKDFHSVTNA